MISLIESKKDDLAILCRRFAIRRLDVFGSAVKGTFDPQSSDLDFIVDLGAYERSVADRFLDFADALETLFGRPVDLITEDSIVNPYFRKAVNAARETVFEDRDAAAAA
ncbi:MAG: nucleotidyltransferase domain-containing protein [Thermomicrobiales bacterium]